MRTVTCEKCKNVVSEEESIQTGELRPYGSPIKDYCAKCFVEGIKVGFGHYDIGNCSTCNRKIVLTYDDQETFDHAKFDSTVHFVCEHVKELIDNGFSDEAYDLIENEEHDYFWPYIIEPDPDIPDFGPCNLDIPDIE